MRFRYLLSAISLSLVTMFGMLFAGSASAAPVKNVILMIADGWGFEQIAATDYYQEGKAKAQVYERKFTPLAMSTYSIDGHGYDPEKAWSDFSYLKEEPTDSAAAATAMATGVKTHNGLIGVDADGKPLENAVERAEKAGKKTGVITTVPFSHATPAGFVAHDPSRGNYAAIAREMLLSSATDVIMGAGHPWFDDDGDVVARIDDEGKVTTKGNYDYVGGPETWFQVLAGTAGADADGDGVPDPWTLVQAREEFRDLSKGDAPKRVFGLLEAASTAQEKRSGHDNNIKDDAPYETPLNTNVPTLTEMTKGALAVLGNDPDGLFLMVEGGAVDWANHANQPGRLIEELSDFNAAVDAVVDWVDKHGGWDNTLLIVTGDHETGYLTGSKSEDKFEPVGNNGKGKMPTMFYHSGGHSNSLIPFFVRGEGSDRFEQAATKTDSVRGKYLDNTDLGRLLLDAVSAPAAEPAMAQ